MNTGDLIIVATQAGKLDWTEIDSTHYRAKYDGYAIDVHSNQRGLYGREYSCHVSLDGINVTAFAYCSTDHELQNKSAQTLYFLVRNYLNPSSTDVFDSAILSLLLPEYVRPTRR